MPRKPGKSKSPLGAILQSLTKETTPRSAEGGVKTSHAHPHAHPHARPAHPRHNNHPRGVAPLTRHTPNKPSRDTAPRGKNNRGGSTFQYSKFAARRSGGQKGVFRNSGSQAQASERSLIPPPEAGVIRIIPLGGVEEIGKNMTLIEIGNDIIIVDAGFQFKTEDTPGIDYIVPNTKYLEERKDKILNLFIRRLYLFCALR
jgi:hypothetical protein